MGRKYLNRLLNKVHVRVLLDRLLTEARAPPPPPALKPTPELEDEAAVPSWIAEDPYGAEGDGEFAKLNQDENAEDDEDKVDLSSFNPYAAEQSYQNSIEHHFHKRS